jgi:hypothetical protein
LYASRVGIPAAAAAGDTPWLGLMPCAFATVRWFARSSWLFAYCTWCQAVRIAPLPGLSSMFG